MKKITLVVFAILSLLSLSACTLFSKEGASDTLTGILSEQSYGDEYNGTHLITNDDGDVYAVNSTILNLSSSEYIGNKVKVQVEYDKTDDVYGVKGVSVLEVLNGYSGVPELVEYMNENLGIKLKYYNNFELTNDPDGIRITAPASDAIDSPTALKADAFTVVRYTGTSDGFLQKFSLSADDFDVKDSIIGDDQLEAKTYSRINGDTTYVVFERSPYVYVISFSKTSTKFYEVLNSFRFVPINENAMVEGTVSGTSTTEVVPTTETTSAGSTSTTSTAVVAPPSLIIEDTGSSAGSSISAKTYDFTGFSDFQSSAYGFKAKYPTRWYYDGTYRDTGALAQYRFADAPIDETNSFGSLKLLSDTSLPSGTKMTFPNGNGVKILSGDQVKFYVQMDGHIYLVEGSSDKADMFEMIAASITKAE